MSDIVSKLPVKSSLATKIACLEPSAADSLTAYAGERYRHILIVCDRNTEKYTPLLSGLPNRAQLTLDGSSHANEKGIAPLEDELSAHSYDCLVACGSGSVHDITRYCAHNHSIDFISFPTAASVDGFVSSVAAMTLGGRKVSFPSSSPVALFADERVFGDAPARLTASGVGDILGKYTALFDWRIANLLCGEPIATEVYELMRSALERLSALLDEIISTSDGGNTARDAGCGSPEYIRCVMECLILAGLSMQLCGNSRPASGAEHHLSHFWEMDLINQPCGALHGESVGCGALMVSRRYHAVTSDRDRFIDTLTRCPDLARLFDRSRLEPVFGDITDGILDENLTNRDPMTSSLNFDISPERAERASDLTSSLISPERLEDYLKAAGAPTTTTELSLPEFLPKFGRSLEDVSLSYAPYVRRRITLLKLLSARDI